MKKYCLPAALFLLGSCASSGIIDYGTNAVTFYYLHNFDDEYYRDKGKDTLKAITTITTPNVVMPVEMKKVGRNPNHYWPLATAELHNDIRNLFTLQVMHVYAASYDFKPPIDWSRSPLYKPFANYGSRITIADELKDLDGIDRDISYYPGKLDDRTMLLYLQALEMKFKGDNATIDYHANACFAGFAPADKKRSGLNSPASRVTCRALFQSLKSYIPVVTGQTTSPTNDQATFGPVFVDFKLVQALDEHSQIKAFFEDDRVSDSDKSELAQRFLKQLQPTTAIKYRSWKETGFKPVSTGHDHFTYVVSTNPKYLYDSDPSRVLHFTYFDVAMAHDFLQYAVLGIEKVSPVRYSGEYNVLYEAMKGPYSYSSVTYKTDSNRFAQNIYPTPLVQCLHNRREQSVSLPKVSRMTYHCSAIDRTARTAIPDPYNKLSTDIIADSRHITGLTVHLNARLAQPTADDDYATTFYKIEPNAPKGVRSGLIERQIPNAFVGRVIEVDGVVYGYVHHQGVAYYILLDELYDYLNSFV